MPVAIERVSLMSDKFTQQLDWDDVIGMPSPSSQINIEIEASGVTTSFQIKVTVTSRLPNKVTGSGTIAAPVIWNVPSDIAQATNPDRGHSCRPGLTTWRPSSATVVRAT
jgi:hypothetical protein